MRTARTEEWASFNGQFNMANLLWRGRSETITKSADKLLAKCSGNRPSVERPVMSDDRLAVMNGFSNNSRSINSTRKNFTNCCFDDWLLLFDHDEFFEASSELSNSRSVDGVGHRHFENPDSIRSNVIVRSHAETFHRLMNLSMGVARGDDADHSTIVSGRDTVEFVEADVLEGDR